MQITCILSHCYITSHPRKIYFAHKLAIWSGLCGDCASLLHVVSWDGSAGTRGSTSKMAPLTQCLSLGLLTAWHRDFRGRCCQALTAQSRNWISHFHYILQVKHTQSPDRTKETDVDHHPSVEEVSKNLAILKCVTPAIFKADK